MKSLQERKSPTSILSKDMEATAARLRTLIASMPAIDLLGHIYLGLIMEPMTDQTNQEDQDEVSTLSDPQGENQFLLEYVHAVLASDCEPPSTTFDESTYAELLELSRKLRQQAMCFAYATSSDTTETTFGPKTAELKFHATSTWIMLRSNRYQVLEGEFYRYVLAPHDDILKQVYGVSAGDIADGFQTMTDVMRTGHAVAIVEVMKQFDTFTAFASGKEESDETLMEKWVAANPENRDSFRNAVLDWFRGGIANVSRHTKLPQPLLADLAYQRGEEKEFFAAGDLAGTPFRTLPARKKPLGLRKQTQG